MDDYEYGVRALERAIMYDPMHPKSYYFLATLVQKHTRSERNYDA